MNRSFVIAALILLAAPSGAGASELGSNLLQVGYLRQGDGAAGPVASVTAEIGDAGWYAGVGHGRTRRDAAHSDTSATWLGYAHGLAPLTDLSVQAGYARETSGVDRDAGYSASLGLARAVLAERAIVSVRANHALRTASNAADTTVAFGIDLYVTHRWSLLIEVETDGRDRATLFALHYNP